MIPVFCSFSSTQCLPPVCWFAQRCSPYRSHFGSPVCCTACCQTGLYLSQRLCLFPAWFPAMFRPGKDKRYCPYRLFCDTAWSWSSQLAVQLASLLTEPNSHYRYKLIQTGHILHIALFKQLLRSPDSCLLCGSVSLAASVGQLGQWRELRR